MDIRKALLLLVLLCILLSEADSARPRAQGRGKGRGRLRAKGQSRGRIRGKGRRRVRKPTVSKAPERTPVYLELPGEEHPIPVYPLAPGSGHEPFTVKVASPHLAGTTDEGTSEGTGSFEPPEKVQSFSVTDAGGSTREKTSPFRSRLNDFPTSEPDSFGSRPSNFPTSEPDSFGSRPSNFPISRPDSFGTGLFESAPSFGRSPPRFPSFETAFEGVQSRRRGARRLVAPAEFGRVTQQVSEVTGQASPDVHPASDPGSEAGEDSDPYEFGYVVNAGQKGAAFGRHETASDGLTRGRYEVKLPDGRIQVVTYTAGGQSGYEADVQYIEQTDIGAAEGA